MEENRKIYSLTELGKSIRSVIERNYTATYWIKAEIAKLNFYPRSGHCYPELVDKAGNVIQAQMRSTIWAADYKHINKKFAEVAGETLREGMAILFRASVGYHPMYGLSLQIWDIEPSFTLGEMALEKARNIDILRKEGVFENNKLQTMPLLPGRMAVISVETSKGYHDFLNILHQHASRYAWWHYLFPTVLQGDKAAEGIMSQLRIIKKAKDRFDFVAIIRGGGGDIGLNCYDDYQLAREIATFPLPVITGIGHATNETIAEMVAWANKITPTDVAYFVVDKFKNFERRVDDAAALIRSKALNMLAFNNQTIDHYSNRIARYPTHLLSTQKGKLGSLTHILLSGTRIIQQKQKDLLGEKAVKLSLTVPRRLFKQRFLLDKAETICHSVVKQHLVHRKNHLDQLDLTIRLLDPQNVLKRGFSVTRLNGRNMLNSSDASIGDILVTRLYNGTLISTVTKEESM
jgi:exodeoxyribonuclease VII large subunit